MMSSKTSKNKKRLHKQRKFIAKDSAKKPSRIKIKKTPQKEKIQRVNVDFTQAMLTELDAEAKRLNISRQAVIKTMLSDSLDRRSHLRGLK